MEHLYKLEELVHKTIKECVDQAERGGLDDRKIERFDKLTHILKSLDCILGKDDDEYSGSYGASGAYSGRRMRSSRTGRWYSGDNAGNNSMDGGSGNNSMGMGNSNRSYGGGQDMAQKLREMASMMESQQGNN